MVAAQDPADAQLPGGARPLAQLHRLLLRRRLQDHVGVRRVLRRQRHAAAHHRGRGRRAAAAQDVLRRLLLHHAVEAPRPPGAHPHRPRPLGPIARQGLAARRAGDRQRQRQLPLRRAPARPVPARQSADVHRRRQHAERRAARVAGELAAAGRAEPEEQLAGGRRAGVGEGHAVAPVAGAGVQQSLRQPAGPERRQEPPGDRPRQQLARAGVPAARPEGGQRRAQRQQVQRRPPAGARLLIPARAPRRVQEQVRRPVHAGAALAAVHRVPQRRREPLHRDALRQHVVRRQPPVRRRVLQPPNGEPPHLPHHRRPRRGNGLLQFQDGALLGELPRHRRRRRHPAPDPVLQEPGYRRRHRAHRPGAQEAQRRQVAGLGAPAIAAAVLAGAMIFFAVRKASMRRAQAMPPRRLVEHASSAYPSKLFADARYISQTVKLGALGIPAYRSFSLVELEAATNDFEVSNLMGQDSHGQMYRGKLSNGTPVTIRSLKVKRSQTSQSFNRHIEMISKLRHRHLVSALGHCFEYNLDDSTVTQLYLVFEYVQNGNLRGRISQGTEGRKLTWVQRISTVIGVAKGIQFLHAGIIPGLFANNLKITNILLDQNLVAKIGSYNIPILSETMKSEGGSGNKYPSDSVPNGDKIDIFDFGVILLEVVSGRPITSIYEVEIMKEQLQSALTAEGPSKRRSFVDPAVSKGCSDESVRTVMEICLRCLAKEAAQRPSVEDVLWNLQFAAQVQDDWRGDSRSSEESPLSPSQIPRESDQY
uniref:Protein kinase domain-containing protein n=1 Tax=Oryza brachyantha TaxID=4533 RepID=J3MIU3_ORYBR